MDQQKWDGRFLSLAKLYATWSKDPKCQVGAVIAVGKDQISQGYNGFPAGVLDLDERYLTKDIKLSLVVHAERNAIYKCASPHIRGSTLYSTLFPCIECSKAIASVGIKRVIYLEELGETPTALYNTETSRLILREAGIIHEKYQEKV